MVSREEKHKLWHYIVSSLSSYCYFKFPLQEVRSPAAFGSVSRRESASTYEQGKEVLF